MCPVSGGAALALMATNAGIVAAGSVGATAIAVGGAAAIGAGIGVAAGGAMNLATGRGFFEGAGKSALFGAVSAGIGSYASGTEAAFFSQGVNPTFLEQAAGYAVSAGSATNIALGGAASSLLGAMTPGTPEYYNAYQQQQQYNSQPSTVTGSGGKQAAYSLAESVRRAKKRKLTQEDVSDLSIDTSSFASEGLQFA